MTSQLYALVHDVLAHDGFLHSIKYLLEMVVAILRGYSATRNAWLCKLRGFGAAVFLLRGALRIPQNYQRTVQSTPT